MQSVSRALEINIKNLILPLVLILAGCASSELSKTPIYKVIKTIPNARINTEQLDLYAKRPGHWGAKKEILKLFSASPGSNNVVFLKATYLGIGLSEEYEQINDIMIIELNQDNLILNALQYTEEWAELPLAVDLFKSTAKGLSLKPNLDVNLMKFVPAVTIDTGSRPHGVIQ